jgi:hypothetical protein
MVIGIGAGILAGGALSAGGSILGGSKASKAASSAAQAQVQAAQIAQQTVQGIYTNNQAVLSPFINAGTAATGQLGGLLGLPGYGVSGAAPGNPITGQPLGTGGLLQPFQPTAAQLAQTPGYQFTLGQGEQAVQNSFAAQGLGSSGPAIKGGVNYAEGLASTTYQQQFNNYWSQLQNYYNMLSGQQSTGAGAAGALAGVGLQTGGQLSNLITGAGAAQAAGTVGSTNALVSGLTGAAGAGANTGLLYSLYNSGMFGSGGGANALTPAGPAIAGSAGGFTGGVGTGAQYN